jgi:glutamine cyclotransferase
MKINKLLVFVVLAFMPSLFPVEGDSASLATVPDNNEKGKPEPVPFYKVRIVKIYPHDPNAFTQGLIYNDNAIYEGTGKYGKSTLRKINLHTGEILQTHRLPEHLFGEGIALYKDKIVQLTWHSHVALIYDRVTFQLLEKKSYPYDGWGITSDGKRMIASDGSDNLYFIDPESLRETGRIKVHGNNGPVSRLNELEYIKGEVYANIFKTNKIARIDVRTGKVTGWIRLDGLPHSIGKNRTPNGIAYDQENDRIFITGKLWSGLYEVELVPIEIVSR